VNVIYIHTPNMARSVMSLASSQKLTVADKEHRRAVLDNCNYNFFQWQSYLICPLQDKEKIKY
jgi:hypothetical protein